MKYTIETRFPNQMIHAKGGTCISIFMPTHRTSFNNKQDSLVFKNLVKQTILSLEQMHSKEDILSLTTLLKQIETEKDFWDNSLDSLVLFATLEKMIIYRVEKILQPIAIVSNGFHIKPLMEYFQVLETFSILALEADSFALYQGNHIGINTVELLDDVVLTLSGILGSQRTDSFLTHGSYGGIGNQQSTFHGHGGKSDDMEIDKEKFFRYIDRFVLENISKKTKYPLLLVTHKEHDFDFRNVSVNPYLLDERVEGSYNNFEENDIKHELKQIFEKRFSIIINKELESYHILKEKELSSNQIRVVLKALLEARVETLFIVENRIIPGKINLETKKIDAGDIENPRVDDVLDDMIQYALRTN